MNQVDHIELSTDDPEKAVAFYAKVFGWKAQSTPTPGGGPPYHMFRTANGGGGITAKMNPEQQPTAWMPYVTVKSVKASLAAAAANGGATVLDYQPIGDMGAIGVFRDPTGGHIGVWEMGKAPLDAAPKKAAAKKPAPKKAAAKKPAPKKAAAKKPAKKKR